MSATETNSVLLPEDHAGDRVLLVIGNSAAIPYQAAIRQPESENADIVIAVNRFGSKGEIVRSRSGYPGSVTIVNYGGGFPDDDDVYGSPAESLAEEVAELKAALADAQNELTMMQDTVAAMRVQRDGYLAALEDANIAELRHHASSLVEHLRDAWWVEAAQHLQEIERLTR